MNQGKIFLIALGVSTETPERFLGPAAIYAITLRRHAPAIVACVEVPAAEKQNSERLLEAARQATQDLLTRAGQDFELMAYLAADERFQGLYQNPYPVLVVPQRSLPKDFIEAAALARRHFEHKRALLKMEFSEIPWDSPEIAAHEAVLKRLGDLGIYNVQDSSLAPAWHEITRRKKLLLHICCGPDAAGVIDQLKRDYDLVCFWYDPNIQPKFEYERRLEAFIKVAEVEQVPYVVGEYDVERFLDSIKGLEHTSEQGAKCSICYDLRLERAAVEAKNLGCDLYTTTLAISPHKVQQKLKNFGTLNERKYGIPYLARNFMKHDGFKDSVKFTQEHGIFRQDYCGCWFSLYEGGANARAVAKETGLTKEQISGGPGAYKLPANDYVSNELIAGPQQGTEEVFKG